MAVVSSHISIIILIVNKLNSKIKRNSVADRLKTRPNYVLLAGDSTQHQRQTQAQSIGMEDDTPNKWHTEKSGCSSTSIRQNRFQSKKVTRHEMDIL